MVAAISKNATKANAITILPSNIRSIDRLISVVINEFKENLVLFISL